MENKIRELTEFATDHEIMIQNMNKRLKLVENIGATISIVSIISLAGFIGLTIWLIVIGI